ncbi:MAG: allophanate hydrolase [OM182 bacterium]|nr:MAG: allophanate hydrolase [OM182 bacterium]
MPGSEEILQRVGGSIIDLLEGYRSAQFTPHEVIEAIIDASSEMSGNPIWITSPDRAIIQPYLDRLMETLPHSLPLWGVPFAVKDNIDVLGMPTTAGCPAFTYQPKTSAFVVDRLIKAGAIPVGKTNLDQFATGLVGVRSPYGIPVNPCTPDLVPGGSSSGSAIALACGLVSFALGTDTAGSGRIPAGFNRLTGFKPTRGLLSTSGVVPACRSLDCVSVFTRSTSDAAMVADTAAIFDQGDAFARQNRANNAFSSHGRWSGALRLAVIEPEQLTFFGDAGYADAYRRTIQRLEAEGIKTLPVDFRPFIQAAEQLYNGPWITERFIAMEDVLNQDPDVVWPVTRDIVSQGQSRTAAEVYRSIYELAALRNACIAETAECDALLTPTAGRRFTLAELDCDPVGPNQSLGHYTNYMNLLDFCGLAIPGLDTESGQPFGITLVGDRFQDTRLFAIGAYLESILHGDTGAAGLQGFKDLAHVDIAVCGAHMAELPLNPQLTRRGAVFIEATKTAEEYRLFALAGGPPMRPGMVRDSADGKAIELEIWRLPAEALATFVADIPSPLGIGLVKVQSGDHVLGFLCEQAGLSGAREITDFGGWRSFLAAKDD